MKSEEDIIQRERRCKAGVLMREDGEHFFSLCKKVEEDFEI